jgi:hypothetical protein
MPYVPEGATRTIYVYIYIYIKVKHSLYTPWRRLGGEEV